LLQPIVVEDNGDGSYTLVGGERRLRAHRLAGLPTIPAEIRPRSNHGGRELLVMGLVENIQRENMNPMDEAEAYQRLHDEYGMTWAEVAKKVGKHPSGIQQIAMLTGYDPEIKDLVRQGKFTHLSDVCRAVMNIPDRDARLELVKESMLHRMTIRQIVAYAKKVAEVLSAPKAEAGTFPAMQQAQGRSKEVFDEHTPPSRWDALQQADMVPPWETVTETARAVCKACALASMASDATCRDCPMVEFIVQVVRI
jgi:ParB/RepB/Spo0J family partition protein